MKISLPFFALLLGLSPVFLTAQGASSLSTQADDLLASGRIGEAAATYEQAARLDAGNTALLYKAAEAYYRVRDYRKAANCYEEARVEMERYELAGLRYARALKQSGRYQESIEAFRQFARQYKGTRKAQIIAVAMNEIKGCELAQRLAQQEVASTLPAEVRALPETVNSPENEYAPVAFSDNLLYYSTLAEGQVKFMRTQRKAGVWQAPTAASGLPEAVSARFGNGTFSPDGKRFFCTQCDEPAPDERGGNGLRTRCNLYLLRRADDGSWSTPERLREYINTPNHTATHPFVTQDRGREILFFASDKEGGAGGLDLYVCERSLDSDELDFSFPQNLGNTVNTAGDEVSPFFDPGSQTLWFSSNSHVSLGGLDVFKTVRGNSKWSEPENAGVPVNSPADDFFFTLKKSGGGFLVSNRTFGATKTSSRDEDIFEVFAQEPPITLSGSVLESGTHQPLADCMVALYELDAITGKRLLEVRPSENGTFQFSVSPRRLHLVEATKAGYQTAAKPMDFNETEVTITLNRQEAGRGSATGDSAGNLLNLADLSPAVPVHTGAVYRVHLEIQSDFNAQAVRYGAARAFGEVIAEPLPEQGIVRVLLGEFEDAQTANEVATALRIEGSFPQAFVVKKD